MFVSRPNAGKSTLTNASVGQKIVIASSKPQERKRCVLCLIARCSSLRIAPENRSSSVTTKIVSARPSVGAAARDPVRATPTAVNSRCSRRRLEEEMPEQRFSVPSAPSKTAATQRTSQRAKQATQQSAMPERLLTMDALVSISTR
jgi:hypothetical protein